MISNENVISYKGSQLLEIYNFYFDGFFIRGHLKTQRNQFQIISTSGFLNKPPLEI